MTIAGVVSGLGELAFCVSVLAFGAYRAKLDMDALRTLAFIAIVFGNQATTYTNRVRLRLGSSRPSAWLLASSVADIAIASALAVWGIAMTPLPSGAIAATLGAPVVLALLVDQVKVPLLRRLDIS
jgi:H+-transporting ATPase